MPTSDAMENVMKRRVFLAAIALLAGCSSTAALNGSDDAAVAGVLTLEWVKPHAIEIRLDGMRYVGEWTSSVCTTDACRGKYRNVLRMYRRHIERGEATLTAPNGARLDCDWLSYLPEVEGECRAPDGRLFKLRAG
jgi:hypothetical protein